MAQLNILALVVLVEYRETCIWFREKEEEWEGWEEKRTKILNLANNHNLNDLGNIILLVVFICVHVVPKDCVAYPTLFYSLY